MGGRLNRIGQTPLGDVACGVQRENVLSAADLTHLVASGHQRVDPVELTGPPELNPMPGANVRPPQELTQSDFINPVPKLLDVVAKNRTELTKVDPNWGNDSEHDIGVSIVEWISGHDQYDDDIVHRPSQD
jgi:hypothetical protein